MRGRHVEADAAQVVAAGEHLGGRSLREDGPLAHHDDAIGSFRQIAHRVGHHHDREPVFVQRRDEVEKILASSRIESRRRFVHHDDVRLHRQHARDGDAALLASRKLEGARLRNPRGIESHAGERPRDALGDLLVVDAEVARSEGDVFGDGGGEQLMLGVLEHHADTPANRGFRLLVGEVDAVGGDAPCGGVEYAVHMLYERALPAAGVPRDAEELPVGHGEVHVVEDEPSACALVRVAHALESNRHSSSSSSSMDTVGDTGTPSFSSLKASSLAKGISRLSCASSSARTRTSSGAPSRAILPRSTTTTRSARAASSMKCVIMTTVMPRSWSFAHAQHGFLPRGSSIAVASSRMRTSGSIASTPAMATRCFWPPGERGGLAFLAALEPDGGKRAGHQLAQLLAFHAEVLGGRTRRRSR